MKKILIVGSQHGNELLGEALYTYIKQKRRELLPCITYMIGNPQAYKRGVRYIESDLNRSYNGASRTYEEQRAGQIIRYITRHNFDLVLDMHTTTCEQPPCLIVPRLDGAILPFLRASSTPLLVHMRHDFSQTALIGACPVAVSIEVNRKSLHNELMEQLCDDISRYLQAAALPLKRTVFAVDELLAKQDISDVDAQKLRNFKKSRHGFTPVLVGENSYKKHTDYLGFKAYQVYQIALY